MIKLLALVENRVDLGHQLVVLWAERAKGLERGRGYVEVLHQVARVVETPLPENRISGNLMDPV